MGCPDTRPSITTHVTVTQKLKSAFGKLSVVEKDWGSGEY